MGDDAGKSVGRNVLRRLGCCRLRHRAVLDLAAYKTFHTDILGTLPQVNAITTFVVMGAPKDERA